jgi:hypothetical protein
MDANEYDCIQCKILLLILVHIRTPSFQSFAISFMSDFRNTSISVPVCFGHWIRIDNIRYFLL